MPVVLELSKGSFGLCRTINAKQLAFFCCDPFQRTLSGIGKFAIYDQFLLLFRISRFTSIEHDKDNCGNPHNDTVLLF